ncbi:MAG: hypothetical protein V1897_06180 [Pseudomonadota bacterium]
MTEIRNTIDLMMERTSGMRLSDEEKQRIKKEELEKKARGYALKLIDINGPNQSVLSLIAHEPPDEKAILESLIWKNMVLGINAENDIKVFFDRLDDWSFSEPKRNKIEELRTKFKDLGKNKNKKKKNLLDREKRNLADAGISGSAVVPKFSKNMERASMAELIEEFKKTLL